MDKIFKELEASNLAESEEARQQLVLLVASSEYLRTTNLGI